MSSSEWCWGRSLRHVLIRLGACEDAIDWVGNKSLRIAWRTCPRTSWLIWLTWALGLHNLAVLAVCDCVRVVLDLGFEDNRPRLAIEAAEAWAHRRPGANPLRAAKAVLEACESGRDNNVCYAAYHAAMAALGTARCSDATTATLHARHALGLSDAYLADVVRARIPYETIAEALERAT